MALGIGVTRWDRDAPRSNLAEEGPVPPRFSSLAMAGNVVFDRICAGCHGVNGVGGDQGPPPIHGIYNPGHHNDESFYRAVRRGVPRHHWNFGDILAGHPR